jgi:predicted O-methyltransferase YrrM
MRRYFRGIVFLMVLLFFCGSTVFCRIDAIRYLEEFHRLDWDTAPGDARFLAMMIEITDAKSALEIGTYRGFAALHMGLALARTGGHLHTLEIHPGYASEAENHLKNLDLTNRVTVVVGNALETIPELEPMFDFVFIDAKKEEYYEYFLLIEPKLSDDAVIVADNAILKSDEMKQFLEYVSNSPDYDMIILRTSDLKGDGMALIHRKK